ncbi:MAG: endonuclease NucS, partial [Candidatus Eremiobacteraeota bacterium]|nr:endonuclease NucS [Candidatus Eremiobacteraeota bacterium]
NEALLETWVVDHPDLLGQDLLIIGRQVRTAHRGIIDLLAVDSEGRVHIIELKRDETPREVVAQALDYASWIVTLESEDLNEICQAYLKIDLATAFRTRFSSALPETLNEEHSMTIVASSLDPSSERIVEYLARHHGLNINAVFFSIFGDGEARMLGRSWLISPDEVEQRAEAKSERRVVGEWTGYYFVNVGESDSGRSWEDCVRYGFISGGQGERYRRAMTKLQAGDKVFAYIVGRGYVGYGTVSESAVMARDFKTAHGMLLDQPLKGAKALSEFRDDEANAEYAVAVDWRKTVDRDHAQTYPGIFANQNIVCRIRDVRTVEFLAERFDVAPQPLPIA